MTVMTVSFPCLLCESHWHSPFILWIDEGNLAPEPQESSKDGVYHYLESVVAWQLAAHRLLQECHRATFTIISVSAVHVTGFKSDVLSADAVIDGLLKRYPNARDLIPTTKSFLQSLIPPYFCGTVHAEATLMGLISSPFLTGHKSNAAKIINCDEDVKMTDIFLPVRHYSLFVVANTVFNVTREW